MKYDPSNVVFEAPLRICRVQSSEVGVSAFAGEGPVERQQVHSLTKGARRSADVEGPDPAYALQRGR